MRRFFQIGLSLFLIVFAYPALALDLPKATGAYVNDFANLLSVQDRASLEDFLRKYEQETTNEIVVVITPSLQGADAFTYSQALFTQWKIGKADKNNGVLFLVGPKEGQPFPERGDVFVNVGGGLEGALPDSMVGTILRTEVFPRFKEKQFIEGIRSGVFAIMQAIKNEYTAPAGESASATTSSKGNIFILLIVFLFFIILGIIGKKRGWKGGSNSPGGGGSSSDDSFGGGSSGGSFGGGSSRGGGAGGSW